MGPEIIDTWDWHQVVLFNHLYCQNIMGQIIAPWIWCDMILLMAMVVYDGNTECSFTLTYLNHMIIWLDIFISS